MPCRIEGVLCLKLHGILQTMTGPASCVQKNRIGLKGPMATPIGKGHRSLNLTLRKELQVIFTCTRLWCIKFCILSCEIQGLLALPA